VLSAYAAATDRAAALSTTRKPVDPVDYKDKFLWKNDEVIKRECQDWLTGLPRILLLLCSRTTVLHIFSSLSYPIDSFNY